MHAPSRLLKPVGIIGLFLSLALSANAALEFSETKVRYEAKPTDEKMEATFRFKNTGDTPVLITKLGSSCGCTVPQLKKNRYMPGESGEITAVFTFGDRIGDQVKEIMVTTSDSATPIVLAMETTIPELLSISPRSLFFHPQDSQPAKSILIESKSSQQPITAVTLQSNDPECKPFLNKTEDGRWLVTVLKPEMSQNKRFTITIKTSFGDEQIRQTNVWIMTPAPSTPSRQDHPKTAGK
ncbi:Protein of unknown function (DUF1573) [Opitutaceae bacterium TAV1]|nr:Protein of unknown function (DUF1573) [Opitutaceae bacterium TAV1]